MDHALTFALLLYFNIFYFGLFASIEFFLLVLKYYNGSLSSSVFANEIFLWALLMGIECVRLHMSQQHENYRDLFYKEMGSVFRILVLTVPSMYIVAYLTMYQTFVTRLDAVLGGIMLVLQGSQLISAGLNLIPRGIAIHTNNRRGHEYHGKYT